MKNIFIYLSLMACFVAFSSCEDELELFPNDSIATDVGFKNINDFNNAIKGVYSGFLRSGYYGATSGAASIYFIPDVISDNVIINANGRRSRETFYDWRYDEDNSSETFWLSAYKVIQRSNLILENIALIDGNPNQANVQGEALAARGIAHFDMAKLYAASPAQDNAGLGIPYVTTTSSEALPARNTIAETYSGIISDLEQAYNLINADNGRGRLNKNVVAALLSRVYLYMEDYSNVLTWTDRVSANPVSRANFTSIWKDATDESVLWKLVVTQPDGITIGVAWAQESPDGIRSEYNVDYSLFQLYEDNDIRKSAYFETSPFNGVDYNHIVKFRGRLVGNANEVDAKVIRYAEVLLNRAEALSETGNDSGALTALNMIRSNRYEGFTSGNETGQALKDAIALERRLELAFEGHRFFDLKRKGLAITRSAFGDEADGAGIPAEFQSLPANNFRFSMAIGQGEIDANENMVQNSGY